MSEIRNKIELRQSRTFSDIHNQQIIIVILNNLKTGKHFVEYTLKIGDWYIIITNIHIIVANKEGKAHNKLDNTRM